MRLLLILLSFLSFSPQVYAQVRDVTIIVNGRESSEAKVEITDVLGDGNCGFYSSEISREEFYARLRQLNPYRGEIIQTIMATFRTLDLEYQQGLHQWFEHALQNNRNPWLNTQGLHLMSVSFNVDITTYAYAVTNNGVDRNRIVRGSVFHVLEGIQILLNNHGLLTEELEPITLMNLGNFHWNILVIISEVINIEDSDDDVIEIEDSSESEDESSNSTQEEVIAKDKKRKVENNSEDENKTPTKKTRSNDYVPPNLDAAPQSLLSVITSSAAMVVACIWNICNPNQ